MNHSNLRGYLKHEQKRVIISVVFFLVLYFVVKDNFILIIIVGVGLFDFIKGFNGYKRKQEYLKALAAQGLTEQEAEDNSFVIKWEKIKKGGMLKYCLVDGGVFIGLWLSMSVGLLSLLIEPSFFGLPVSLLQLIEFSCPIGVFLGIFLSFFIWSVHEKKFARLTEPLH